MKHLLDTRIGDYHAMVPMAEVDTIGCRRRSVAAVDDGGMFRVGPRSAGAAPGPACYNRGGTEPTSTDAMVVMGWLREDSFLSGAMTVVPQLAEDAVRAQIAEQLGTSLEQAAMGIFTILAHSMTEAISLHSVRKGYDPRDFSLVAEGGAGPLFAWQIAEQLDIPRVIVPGHPGITSAVGLLTTDIRYEVPTTVWTSSDEPDVDLIRTQVDRLSEQATAQLRADGVADEDITLERSVDCRYLGQGYELRVAAPDGEIDAEWVKHVAEAFHEVHGRTYSQRFDDKSVQLINVRVTGVGAVPHVRVPEIEQGGADASHAIKTTTKALFWERGSTEPAWHETPVYRREELLAGQHLHRSGHRRAVRLHHHRRPRPAGHASTPSATSSSRGLPHEQDPPCPTHRRLAGRRGHPHLERRRGRPDHPARDRRRPRLDGQGDGAASSTGWRTPA